MVFYAPLISTICSLKFYTEQGFLRAKEEFETGLDENTFGSDKDKKTILGDGKNLNMAWTTGQDSDDIDWTIEEPVPPKPSDFKEGKVAHGQAAATQLAIG